MWLAFYAINLPNPSHPEVQETIKNNILAMVALVTIVIIVVCFDVIGYAYIIMRWDWVNHWTGTCAYTFTGFLSHVFPPAHQAAFGSLSFNLEILYLPIASDATKWLTILAHEALMHDLLVVSNTGLYDACTILLQVSSNMQHNPIKVLPPHAIINLSFYNLPWWFDDVGDSVFYYISRIPFNILNFFF